MVGNLEAALQNLIQAAYPRFFTGTTPLVRWEITHVTFQVDPDSADATASEPRPDDRTDRLPFDSDAAAGPYMLSQPPYPGPRRLWLTTTAGDRVTLQKGEVVWNPSNSQQFTLALRPSRDLSVFSTIEVLYGITAVFTKLKLSHTLTLTLSSSDTAALGQSESLLVGLIALNRQALIDTANATYEEGEYGVTLEIKNLLLTQGSQTEDNSRTLTLAAESELKATRALREDEGMPIERILTNGRPRTPDRAIDIHIDVNA